MQIIQGSKTNNCPEYHILLRHVAFEESEKIVEDMEAKLLRSYPGQYKRQLILEF